jgi:hypothetical protein
MSAATGTLISFSAQPGGLAIDGPADGNSPYTMALLEKMRTPGLNVLDVFNEVGVTVARGTNRMQQPWVSNSPIEGRFYFTPAAQQQAAVQPGQTPAGPQSTIGVDPQAMDLTFWQSIQNSRNPAAFEEYLRQYPRGRFAGLARIQLEELRRQQEQGSAQQPAQPQTQPQAAQPSGADRSALDFAFWQSIQNSRDPAEFEAYLQQFPQGTFAPIARARIEALRSGAAQAGTQQQSQQQRQQVAALPQQQQADPARGVIGIRACPTDFQTFRDANASVVCTCSADAATSTRPIYGSGIYTDDSPICRAAVHAGAVTPDGGTVVVRQRGPQVAFESSTRNGVTTLSWVQSQTSFSVARAGEGGGDSGPQQSNTQAQQQTQQQTQQQAQQEELRRQQEELRRQQEELRRQQEQQRLAQQQEELRRQQEELRRLQEQQRLAQQQEEQRRQQELQRQQQLQQQQQQQQQALTLLPRCPATAAGVRGQLACLCTASMVSGRAAVFGTDVYSRESSICGAARHAGAIGANGGAIIVNMLGTRPPTQSSQRNGINSVAWPAPDVSFAVSRYSQ